ncbi:MAG: DegT/DnrJ/EryC1/StrS family aminotransferase [Gammaproteobacteria bacterium CG_4_10_14_0_8_um_filter_38_16]|nr:MAG: DegT/DnrJ/EryC1/StrS family aminotransferase [Gammaproteobacteria bacterium CG_4_10_14_0_8_um_filter_38_16]PJA04110.1 MAG: DegT/DnrJ/EryC1/StrS family aminotransferase [Gammaproteobacteria bacterium CG_4_10_14_0_2_um_filter_38_22]PJB10024.1 MAG: DegT/DnrJ/EryC1/StrS family aminotransferase [Gammaproteobacteria bacterium CG_4_9_14_3_um_filter_38_9]
MTTTELELMVPFVNFQKRYLLQRDEILSAVDNVLASGVYILGEWVIELEKKLAAYLNCPYVLTLANGTDAIILALKILDIGPGDEVIVPVNSFIASAGAVIAVGAKPVFCDVSQDLNIDVTKIEKCITKRTKALMPVHLTGRPADMDVIMKIAKKNNLFVIEDAAQSIGAMIDGEKTGTIGDFGCFSLHPLKNLHAYGDGGIIATKNEAHYEKIKLLRNHGLKNRDTCEIWGLNSRLDSIQAKMVLLGLNHIDEWNARRRSNAMRYQAALKNIVAVPIDSSKLFSVYHNFVILTDKRDALAFFLKENGIDTRIHYPIPLHRQPAAKNLNYKAGDFPVAEQLAKQMLSLPIYPELSDEQIDYVISKIKEFFICA